MTGNAREQEFQHRATAEPWRRFEGDAMNMNSMPGLDRHLNSGNPMDDSSGDAIDVIAGELNTMPIAELVETFIQFRSEAELRELLNDDDLASEVFDSRVESANDDAEQHKADSRDDDRYGY